MVELLAPLPGYFLIFSFIYLFFLKNKIEKKRNELIFDNQVLGFIDGLYLSSVKFKCTDFEMRAYVKKRLSDAHKLPGNKFLFDYTTAQGQRYVSHTSPNGDHILFAVLCIAQYAKETESSELVTWCESMMETARRNGNMIHW